MLQPCNYVTLPNILLLPEMEPMPFFRPMKLDFSGDRVLAVVAHPDDAELLCAGTLARAKQAGAAIGICVLCQGDKGQPNKPIKNLAGVRRKEMQAAAAISGAELFLGEF